VIDPIFLVLIDLLLVDFFQVRPALDFPEPRAWFSTVTDDMEVIIFGGQNQLGKVCC
jgi:hypothetical protein